MGKIFSGNRLDDFKGTLNNIANLRWGDLRQRYVDETEVTKRGHHPSTGGTGEWRVQICQVHLIDRV